MKDVMKDVMYCIECETWEPVINGGHVTYIPAFEDSPAEIDFCTGPFTYSEPPEIDEDEYNSLNEPDYDELEQINQEAENIMQEVE